MKKYIAFLLAALLLTLPSCGSSESAPEETDGETAAEAAETEAPAETEPETEKPKYERPANEEVIHYTTLELLKDAVYDRAAGLFLMYFTNNELLYSADSKCSIGLISDEEAVSITGKPDMTAYPDMQIDEDDFCGIAIKVDEEIPTGDYLISVTFENYIVSFEQTIQ